MFQSYDCKSIGLVPLRLKGLKGLQRTYNQGLKHLKRLIMDLNINFDAYWQAIGAEPEFATYKNATREQWAAYPDKQRPIMEWLHKHGPYKGRNPYFFIQDFKIRQHGWHRKFLPDEQKTIYVKTL